MSERHTHSTYSLELSQLHPQQEAHGHQEHALCQSQLRCRSPLGNDQALRRSDGALRSNCNGKRSPLAFWTLFLPNVTLIARLTVADLKEIRYGLFCERARFPGVLVHPTSVHKRASV
jgi:hypothetical protein